MRHFLQQLQQYSNPTDNRQWAYVPYDQLSDQMGLLGQLPPDEVGIVLVESAWKPRQRKYHKQKLALLLSSQRHFALEQAARGVAVRYVFGDADYASLLRPVIEELGPLQLMEPAERELRENLGDLIRTGSLPIQPNDGWLTQPEDFRRAMRGKANWRMDAFYRTVRKRYEILLDPAGKPIGGKWSHDAANREPWKGQPPAPTPLQYTVDEITVEVCELIERRYTDHPGQLRPNRIPATIQDVERTWQWALEHCMPHFGPYEDAMSTQSVQLFHVRVGALMNLHRLLPRRVLTDVLELDLPINCQEGFVRQVLGWREFMRHVHVETDGFRRLPGVTNTSDSLETAPSPSFLNSRRALPATFWGTPSGLNCLDHVVQEVWDEAYTHHINRLMILSNWATLLDIEPRQLSDWFWVAFEDAFEWVVEPNVMGMGTFGLGELMVTKPYVSGSAYVNRMSDYCSGCAFDPKKTCPMTSLYWAFLERHLDPLSTNPRLRIILGSLRRRSAEKKRVDAACFESVSSALQQGLRVQPEGPTRPATPLPIPFADATD